jgi:hypothetical protein
VIRLRHRLLEKRSPWGGPRFGGVASRRPFCRSSSLLVVATAGSDPVGAALSGAATTSYVCLSATSKPRCRLRVNILRAHPQSLDS